MPDSQAGLSAPQDAVAPKAAAYANADTADSRAALAGMAEAYAATNTASSSTYKIGAFDVLEINVFQVSELSKTLQVSEAGTINYPLIGEVPVAGMSVREVELSLTQTLGAKYLRNPQVAVLVREYNSQRVTVQGAAKKPGIYPIQGRLTLLQLMALAGGLDAMADDTAVIFRTENGKRGAARFDIKQLQSGAVADPQLQAGDMVVVGTSAIKENLSYVLKALPLASVFMWF